MTPAGSSRRELFARRLACGASLVVLRNATLPIFSCQVLIDAGHLVEQPDEDGLMGLAGSLLLSGGAGDRTGAELFELLESSGVRYSTLGSGLRLQAPVHRADLVYDVMADAVRRPSFEPARFELEHSRLRTQLQAAAGDLRLVARHELSRVVYGEAHPLGRPARGTLATVAQHTRERVVEFFTRQVGPERLLFAVTGDVDPDVVVAELDGRLGDWQRAVPARPTFAPLARRTQGESHFLERNKDKLHVYFGHLGIRRTDPDFYPLLVLDQIFGCGSGFTSRLSNRVRDQLGLAYSVYGTISETAGREPGMLLIYAGTFPNKLDELATAVRSELDRLLTDGVTAEEVADASRYACGSFLFETETNQQLAELALSMQLHGLPLDFLTSHPQRISEVTAEAVTAAARRHLHPESLITVACGRRAPE